MKRGRPRHPDVLTPAEWRVVQGVRHGMSNSAIGRRLHISLDAVKYHVANALGSALQTKQDVMTDTALGAIGQISRQVRDIGTAVAWYRDVLGLRHLFTFGDLAFFDCDGIRLFLTSRQEKDSQPGDSVVYFKTDDIEEAHRTLTTRGVTFRGAPHMIHRHESGVEEWMAFFEDLDGKVLALMSQVSPRPAP